MHLTLCLPGLLLPRQALVDTVADLELPALSRLLGQARQHRSAPLPHYAGIARGWHLDAFPAAALRRLGEGAAADADAWICLDPVHLGVDRRGVKLADPALLALDAAEDAALREGLAPLFAELGELHGGGAPGHWHLRLNGECDLVVRDLPDAVGIPVDPSLPGGGDGARWRRLLAEAQSALHVHPVNRARDAAGRPLANYLWPWGQGRLAARPAASGTALWARDPVLRGLALAAGIAAAEPPPRFRLVQGDIAVVLDDLVAPARSLDALAWRETLERIERDWLDPALAAVAGGRCASLRLSATGPETALEIEASRLDLLKFWRRPQPLAKLAA